MGQNFPNRTIPEIDGCLWELEDKVAEIVGLLVVMDATITTIHERLRLAEVHTLPIGPAPHPAIPAPQVTDETREIIRKIGEGMNRDEARATETPEDHAPPDV